jgi:hypothetical protein
MAFDPISAVANLVETVVDKIFPDANDELRAKLAQATLEIQTESAAILGQLEINKEEAKHASVFVAGARPAAMWVSVLSLLYGGVGVSFLSWIALCFGLPPIPAITDTMSSTILMGLLGLGAARSYDKSKGVDTRRVG